MKTQPTGYWTFYCSPAKWMVDEFLESGVVDDNWGVEEWQTKRDWFGPGQLGVVRVGRDGRTKSQRAGRKRLLPGVYAIVEVMGPAHLRGPEDVSAKHWLVQPPGVGDGDVVPLRIVRNLLHCPVLLEHLPKGTTDPRLLDGRRASSMPLDQASFEFVAEFCGGLAELPDGFPVLAAADSNEDLAALALLYADATPVVKEALIRRIERGSLASQFRKHTKHRCLVCECLGMNPIGFTGRDGLPYVEVHHVTPVSTLEPGALGWANMMTVCANHHRQIHYGNVERLAEDGNCFVFSLDGQVIHVPRLGAAGM